MLGVSPSSWAPHYGPDLTSRRNPRRKTAFLPTSSCGRMRTGARFAMRRFLITGEHRLRRLPTPRSQISPSGMALSWVAKFWRSACQPYRSSYSRPASFHRSRVVVTHIPQVEWWIQYDKTPGGWADARKRPVVSRSRCLLIGEDAGERWWLKWAAAARRHSRGPAIRFSDWDPLGPTQGDFRRQTLGANCSERGVCREKSTRAGITPLVSSGFPSWTSPVRVRSPAPSKC
jgi:hypothetical protein